MDTETRVADLIESDLAEAGVELVEVTHQGGILRVSVDRDGGVDLETLATLTRQVSAILDDADPVPGRYTLEVSSPGLERPLRNPDQLRRAVGRTVAVNVREPIDGESRIEGELMAADDDGIVVAGVSIAHSEIRKARTTFEWGPKPKPGGKHKPGSGKSRSDEQKKRSTAR